MLYTKSRSILEEAFTEEGCGKQVLYCLCCLVLFTLFVLGGLSFVYRPLYLAACVLLCIFVCAGYEYASILIRALRRKRQS